MTSIIIVDTIQTSAGATPTASSLGIDGVGKIGQVVQTTKTDIFSTSAVSYVDVTGVSASITPSSTSSKVWVMVNGSANMSSAGSQLYILKLLRDSTALGGVTNDKVFQSYGATLVPQSITTCLLDSPNTTSSVTYKLQAYVSGDTLYIGSYNASVFAPTTITLMEVLA